MNKLIILSKEVEEAIKNKKAIVALESTIISHGMPYPQNVETALNCERIVRENGAVPATIAIINGEIHVGLTNEQIDYVGRRGTEVIKTSRRDLPVVVAKHQDGATTVAATMAIAAMAGIKFFATGGIGGVHRGAEVSMDISADLDELKQTDVCVVCAGIKAILDLDKTLEVLETKGVPVIGYQTNMLPAFYCYTSPYELKCRCDTPLEIAEIIKAKHDLNLEGGTLVTNPIPKEESLDEKTMYAAIDKALANMEKAHVKGKDQTPFLLKEVVSLTGGKSLESNIKLVFNNCKLASMIAVEYNKLCD